MKSKVLKSIDDVIRGDFCTGCGACTVGNDSPFSIKMNKYGEYKAVRNNDESTRDIYYYNKVCPFLKVYHDENSLSENLYSQNKEVKYDDIIGYYLGLYGGHVASGGYRESGSSGGFTSWISSYLLRNNYVDAVIHVKSRKDSHKTELFEYQVSESVDEVLIGSKSKYYPVEMSKVLEYVKKNPKKYLVIGVPCFIKSVRLLQELDNDIQECIQFTISLVCGHFKSIYFTNAIAYDMGVLPSELQDINFRKKNNKGYASQYNVEIKSSLSEEETNVLSASTTDLFVTNWGHGLFKYKGCDYCDDIFGETADLTIGDAWIRKYNIDPLGSNILITRSPIIEEIIRDNFSKGDLRFDSLSEKEMKESQLGGIRHKKEGLAYRLYLLDNSKQYVPIKRVKAKKDINNKRKNIYVERMNLRKMSFKLFVKVDDFSSFQVFKNEMERYIKRYNKLYDKNIMLKIMKRIIRVLSVKLFRR